MKCVCEKADTSLSLTGITLACTSHWVRPEDEDSDPLVHALVLSFTPVLVTCLCMINYDLCVLLVDDFCRRKPVCGSEAGWIGFFEQRDSASPSYGQCTHSVLSIAAWHSSLYTSRKYGAALLPHPAQRFA